MRDRSDKTGGNKLGDYERAFLYTVRQDYKKYDG